MEKKREYSGYIEYWDEAIRQWANSPVPAFMKSEKYWLEPTVAKRVKRSVAEAIGLQPELLPNPSLPVNEDNPRSMASAIAHDYCVSAERDIVARLREWLIKR